MIADYFKSIGFKRMVIMVIGNIFVGMGISIFKLSGLGNDPFSGAVMALADLSGISYASLLVIINSALFVIQFIFGRKLIGIGTLVNAVFLGYIVTFFYDILICIWISCGSPSSFPVRTAIVFIGVIVISLGVSLYQTSAAGIAPYDSLALITSKKWTKFPYFWHRIFTDGFCAFICFLTGGIVGLGTLVSAFGLGPFVQFFDTHLSSRLVK